MQKQLLFTLLFILFLIPAFAQTHEDSVKNKSIADTTLKRAAIDTTIKKRAVDSVVKRQPPDTIKHITTDSVTKVHQADSTVKHLSYKVVIKPPAIDTELKPSPVKTINDTRYNAYLKGDDLDDMSLAGDLNHFPSPDKVLKYKKQLDLSPIQVGQLTKLTNELHRKKIEMGTFIIRNEKMLDSLFHLHQVDEGSLIFYTNRSGLYYGELKGAILMACYNTEKLLTPAQIKKLEELEKAN
jgi:hypothetical protein